MPEMLRSMELGSSTGMSIVRLIIALAMGALVAVIYKWARSSETSSFTATLVFLSILIAMVTQVIGDNVARAFSLVGALSIVRFRTVVRDTQDTAYVIFAVAVGMAVGAGYMGVALAGTAVVALAAAAMKRPAASEVETLPFRLTVRLGLGFDTNRTVAPTLDTYVSARSLVGVSTVKQGAAIEYSYQLAPLEDAQAQELVSTLNRLDGVQGVALERRISDAD
jgi:hypothetical protein